MNRNITATNLQPSVLSDIPQAMEYTIHQAGKSAYVIVGPKGATNFTIVKDTSGAADLVDADIRRIDEVEEALRFTGCAKVEYLMDTHEHFDHAKRVQKLKKGTVN